MSFNLPVPVTLSANSLEAYIQSVQQIPLLSAEEETSLAYRFRTDNDLEAARRLVLPHLRFVVRIARGYSGYGLPLPDLIQEGNIGLMKAVKRFDPEQGVRLVSFAVHWIRAEIHEFILRNWRIVKVATTKAQRKLFFNLRSSKKRLGWLSRGEADEVASDLDVKPEAVLEMESRMNGRDVPFDGRDEHDDEEGYLQAPAQYIPDLRMEPAAQLERSNWDDHLEHRLHRALGELDERSRDILMRRWLAEPKAPLRELAQKYAVSAERIRQLEKNAFRRLKGLLEA